MICDEVPAVRLMRNGDVVHFHDEPFYLQRDGESFLILWVRPAPGHLGFRFYSEFTVSLFLLGFNAPRTPITA